MTSYSQLFMAILPVFAMVAIGGALRHWQWITESAETSLFNLVIKIAMPCLIFESVAGNASLHQAGNLLLPPLAGFVLTLISMVVAWYVARALGLTIGHGLRTFALAVGLTNYGYLPIPIMDAMFGPESRAVLLVHNVGVEAAIWTGGVLVVTGLSPLEGWRKLINAPAISLVLALTANLTGATSYIPALVMNLVHSLGVCAIPMGLIMTGVTIEPHFDDPKQLIDARVTLTAWLLRLGV
ncbi:MAG TPA: AEC family transporter, partial [Candidatus Didemnitutus sp.]|nr:AEC family transporter [Candidatus Didemnitutus sp.]